MALHALICIDRPGQSALRRATRAEHLAYIEETGVVVQAGPLLDDAGEMIGSLVILDVADRAEAARWGAGDPYARAGLFATVAVHRWKKVIG